MELHLAGQHAAKWAAYNDLENEQQRDAIFEEHGGVYRNTLPSHFVSEAAGERSFFFEIDQSSVETIIRDMPFKPADLGEQDISPDDGVNLLYYSTNNTKSNNFVYKRVRPAGAHTPPECAHLNIGRFKPVLPQNHLYCLQSMYFLTNNNCPMY